MDKDLDDLVFQIRRDILRMVHGVNSGHPGGSLGCVEFFVTLLSLMKDKLCISCVTVFLCRKLK